jgi:U6 snRNA-associated Sm-like protein LSm2
MIFFSFFKTLVGKEVVVEMKNDVTMTGILLSVDQYLNVKLKNISVLDPNLHPQLAAMSNCFIRGSAVRYYLLLLLFCLKISELLFVKCFFIQIYSNPCN